MTDWTKIESWKGKVVTPCVIIEDHIYTIDDEGRLNKEAVRIRKGGVTMEIREVEDDE